MKKIAIILSLLFLTNSAFAGSCPMMAQNIDSKIEEAQKRIAGFDIQRIRLEAELQPYEDTELSVSKNN